MGERHGRLAASTAFAYGGSMESAAGVARRAHWLLVLAVACTPARHEQDGSRHEPTPQAGDACSVAHHVEVPLASLGELSDAAHEVPFGDRFALVDSDSVTLARTAAIALISWHGIDAQKDFELTGLCPGDVCRNIHGTGALRTGAGNPEFLLAEQGSSVSMPAYPLRLLAWEADGIEPAVSPLFDSRVTAITTRSDLQSSCDAERAVFALGNIDTPSLGTAEIAAGAALVAEPASMTLPSLPWDCLTVVPTETAGALSVVSRPDDGNAVVWTVRELAADAGVVYETSVTVPAGEALGYGDCPTVLESPRGFHAQWTNTNAQSIVATVARSDEPGAEPALVRFETSPGLLAGVLHDEFLFLAASDDAQQSFVRRDSAGGPGGPDLVLPLLPESTSEAPGASAEVLRVSGSAVDVSYEAAGARVFEELDCP